MNRPEILAVRDLCFSYGSGKILSGVDLQLNRGEIFCLLGPNGSGKTTLLDCILGILSPGRGEILLEGQALARFSPRETALRMAYVPQGTEKNFPFSVLDVLLMGRTAYSGLLGSPGREDRRKALEILKSLDLLSLKDRDYTRLSGGESRLVMIMRALVQESPLILMDEPTCHLDFRNELKVLEIIAGLSRIHGRTVLMSTHSPNQLFYLEQLGVPVRAGLLQQGCLIRTGTPAEVLTEENMWSLYGVRTARISGPAEGDTRPPSRNHLIPIGIRESPPKGEADPL